MENWQICNNCDGNGKHSKRLGIITSSTREEWTDEEFNHYMKGGFDVTCEVCDGNGKVEAEDNRQEKSYATDEEYYWKRAGGY